MHGNSDDNSINSPLTCFIKPPLHPQKTGNFEESMTKILHNRTEMERKQGWDKPKYHRKDSILTNNDELVPFLVNKVVDEALEDPQELEDNSPIEPDFDYFNDKFLKFKLMKVKNIFEPTYHMEKAEGEKIRK